MKNIKRIYFISDEDDRALVIYYEGKKYIHMNVSIDKAKELLSDYAKDNGYDSLKELKDDGIYDVIKSNEIPNRVMDLLEQQSKEEEKNMELIVDDVDDVDETLGNKVDKLVNSVSDMKIDKLKVKKYAITAGLILGGVLVVDGIYNLGKYSGKRNSNTTESIGTTTVVTTEDVTEEDTKSFISVDDVIENADINDSKREAVASVWEYIKFYNGTISSAHLCSDGSHLAHSWEEIMTDYLVYNTITGEEAIQIFDDCNLDINELKNNYTSSIEQSVMSYVVLTEPSCKETLIKSETGKDFYKKYEDMIIRFNKTGDDVESKEKIATEFYQEVYKDYLNGSTISENDSYKLSVIPIIKAFNLLTQDINCDIKLSDEDSIRITDMGNGIAVSNYLESICNYVNSYKIELDEDITYTNITTLATEELSDSNLYNLDNRDITNSVEYQNMFKKSEEKNNNNNNTTRGYSGRSYNQSVANSAGMIQETPEESSSDEIPDWLLNEEDQGNGYNGYDENQTNAVDDSVNDEIPAVEEDTPGMKLFKENYYESLADIIIEQMASQTTNEINNKATIK